MTLKQVLALDDRMTPALSKASKQAIANIDAYQKLDKQIRELDKAEQQLYETHQTGTATYKQLTSAMAELVTKRDEYLSGARNASIETDNNSNSFKTLNGTLVNVNQGLEIVSKGFSMLKGLMQEATEWIEESNNQFNQEFLSATRMHSVLGATSEEIQSMYDYAAALQQTGVVGDEAILAGAQELAVYTENTEQLRQLIPAVTNLAVSQNGLNTSQSNVASMAGYLGRALEGSSNMLVRQGVLTKQQAKYMDDMSSKSEKVAYLTEIVSNKYGEVNQALANTAQGGMMQLNNRISDMKEKLGNALTPALEKIQKVLVDILEPVVNWAAEHMEIVLPIIGAIAAALVALGIIMLAHIAKSALMGLSWIVAYWPVFLVIAIIAALIAILCYLWDNNDEVAAALVTAWDYVQLGITAAGYAIRIVWNSLQMALLGLKIVMQTVALVILRIWDGIASGIENVVGGILTIVQGMVNGIIDMINGLADGIASIPVIGDLIGEGRAQHVTFADDFKAGAAILQAGRAAVISGMESGIADTASQINDLGNENQRLFSEGVNAVAKQKIEQDATRDERVKNRTKIGEKAKSTVDSIKNFINNPGGTPDGLTPTDESALGGVTGTDSSGAKAIRTTTNDSLLSDEDIQLLLDVATRDYKLNYQQVTPEITLTFGDVRETADVDDMLDKISDRLEEIYAGNLEVV